jgi:diguanylate cyclase (GGDEF)-like protein
MKLTDQSLAEQLHITPHDIARRKELLRFTKADATLLLNNRPYIAEEITSIVEEFYADQISKPEIERLIGDVGTLGRLKHHMTNYLLDMFDGVYDDVYVLSRLRVGLVHDRIGVSPKLYISSVRTLLEILRRRLTGKVIDPDKACDACQSIQSSLVKILLFDLTLVFDTYIHALLGQVERAKDEIEQYAHSLEEEVVKRTSELAEMARRDPLTGLANQRALFDALRRDVARCLRQTQPLTVAYMDMDHFKEVNDSLGHQEGDRVLQTLADAMRKVLRAEDLPARIGGDEFCVVLPGVGIEKSREIIGRLAAAFDASANAHGVTLSVGLAAFDLQYPQIPEHLIRQADQAMYLAKNISGHSVVEAEADGQERKA